MYSVSHLQWTKIVKDKWYFYKDTLKEHYQDNGIFENVSFFVTMHTVDTTMQILILINLICKTF